jgi:hypothetical protein
MPKSLSSLLPKKRPSICGFQNSNMRSQSQCSYALKCANLPTELCGTFDYIADSILLNTVTAKLQILLSTTTFMLTLSPSDIVNHTKSDPITYINISTRKLISNS